MTVGGDDGRTLAFLREKLRLPSRASWSSRRATAARRDWIEVARKKDGVAEVVEDSGTLLESWRRTADPYRAWATELAFVP